MPWPGTSLFPQSTGLYPGGEPESGINLWPSSSGLWPSATGLFPGGGDSTEVLPTVVTGPASNMTTSNVTLAGSIDPHGFDTHYGFQYGNEGSYGYLSPSWVLGTAPSNISRTVGGLDSATFYHYRLVAWSAAGTAYGGDLTFATDFGPNDYRPSPVHDAGWIQ